MTHTLATSTAIDPWPHNASSAPWSSTPSLHRSISSAVPWRMSACTMRDAGWSQQYATPVPLEKGKPYYLECRHYQGGGGNHFSAAMRTPAPEGMVRLNNHNSSSTLVVLRLGCRLANRALTSNEAPPWGCVYHRRTTARSARSASGSTCARWCPSSERCRRSPSPAPPPARSRSAHPHTGDPTAMQTLRIGRVGFGTGRQKTALERWTNPKLSRRTCTCEYGLQS
jgi:hypothetical protein